MTPRVILVCGDGSMENLVRITFAPEHYRNCKLPIPPKDTVLNMEVVVVKSFNQKLLEEVKRICLEAYCTC